ncbi:MAG: ribonuclease R [Flavobacteriales bacterium]
MPKKTHKQLAKQVTRFRNYVSQLYRDNPKDLMNYKQLAARLDIKDAVEKQILVAVLEAMVKDKLLIEEQRGKFRWNGPVEELEGIISFNRSGNAFVEISGMAQDVMIPENYTGKAFHEDRVLIRLLSSKKGARAKGKVVEIVERARVIFPCVIFQNDRHFFAIPDNQRMNTDFFIPADKLNGAKAGDKVVVRFEDWENIRMSPVGSVEQVLGRPGDMRAEGDAILAEFGFPLQFPKEVEDECLEIDRTISDEVVESRRDFRDILTFTIDPEDAKDFDDALSFRVLENGNTEVGVHIADVTHYVRPGSSIEKEAQNRATSVYLVDRVIPMLPETLSNELCSLRPKEDKLTFSAVFELDKHAQIKSTWLGKTLIHSDHRFTYEEVQTILEGGTGLYSSELTALNNFAKTIRHQRMEHGAIAFEKGEVRFRLDEQKKPVDVLFKVQKDAHKLIEEFMLLANKAVATHVGKKTKESEKVKTFVYRIHDQPDPMKLKEFAHFVKRFGYSIDLNTPQKVANSINALLKIIKGKPEQNMIEMLAIRSMAKAEYATDNIGHFGLAFPFYSHFTSPIRRYPDMIAHRLLHSYLNGGSSAKLEPIEKLCKHSSIMERKAADAERESTKLYQVLYMKDFEGEVFDGVVSGVTEWGVFVEISANKCEGMVRLRDIKGDYYFYDQKNMAIVGQRTKATIRLGEQVAVKVVEADLENRRIDLTLV